MIFNSLSHIGIYYSLPLPPKKGYTLIKSLSTENNDRTANHVFQLISVSYKDKLTRINKINKKLKLLENTGVSYDAIRNLPL